MTPNPSTSISKAVARRDLACFSRRAIYQTAPTTLFFAASGVQRNPDPSALRAKSNLLKQFSLIPPVQSHLKKFSASPPTQITSIFPAVPSHRGRWTQAALLTRALLRTEKSYGPGASTLASSLRIQFADDGDKNARSPGRIRRKPLKPLRAGMPGDQARPR